MGRRQTTINHNKPVGHSSGSLTKESANKINRLIGLQIEQDYFTSLIRPTVCDSKVWVDIFKSNVNKMLFNSLTSTLIYFWRG